MKRHISTEAIVLTSRPFGEIHKNLKMMTPDQGIIHAAAYGALKTKGKMRNYTNIFSCIKCQLYANPVKNSLKITDARERFIPMGLREDLLKYYTACLWTELIILSNGGGHEHRLVYYLLKKCILFLDSSTTKGECHNLNIQFIFRFLGLLGLAPDPDNCVSCRARLGTETFTGFSFSDGGFLCGNCIRESGTGINPAERRFLSSLSNSRIEQALTFPIGINSFNLRSFLYKLVQYHMETPVKTFITGKGIL